MIPRNVPLSELYTVGTAAVAVVMALARPAFGDGVALSAGVLLATNFLHVRDSHAVKPDALLSLMILLALAAMVPLTRAPTVGRSVIAGVAIGLAVAVKYPAVFLLGVAYLATSMGTDARGWRRLFPGSWFLICTVAAATFTASSYYVLLNPATRSYLVNLLGTMYPQVSPKEALPLPPIPGYPMPMDQPWWGSLAYYARFALRYGAGLPAALFAPAAVVWGLASGSLLAVLTAAAAVLYYLMMSGSPVALARYMTPLMPWLALLEAGLLGALASRIRDRRLQVVALALATLALAAEPLRSAVAHNRVISRTDTRVLATRWMAEHLPRGAKVRILGNQVWFWGQPQLPPGVSVSFANADPDSLRQAGVGYVVAHEHELFSSRVAPADLERLAPSLHLLVEFDPFTPGGPTPTFEAGDAYYVPFHGFAGVTRPGPRVRIYAFDKQGES